MVLAKAELPEDLQQYLLAKEGILDNEAMAEHSFSGTMTEGINASGRITGYVREFATPLQVVALEAGSNMMAATVAHLFQEIPQVSQWINERFLGEFQRAVGQEVQPDQKFLAADRLDFEGFFDEAVGVRTLQTTPAGTISSTIVDFRLGRLLGVAYVVAMGDVERRELVQKMGIELERKMVKVLLGTV
jgi:hypothetical protein